MKLTKRLHSCVQLEKDGRVLVIDPGAFSEPDAGLGADALLVTHEHPDHFEEGRLRAALDANPAAALWTLRSVAERLAPAYPGRVHTVGHGDAFSAAGFEVQVHGELHAVIHPDIPRVTNVGYLVEGSLFHPGDALTVPEVPVDTLMLPVHAPWNKVAEVIDYLREVKPRRAIDIHDAYLSDIARPIYDGALAALGGTDHGRLAAGEAAQL
ncbi:L-ascorbate metabolism protein UlaG (beta-lactamase superfamily) [Streptomyces sp. 2132.2]|uniref:MBL fold metallo-hydrolase n=1 Tax=Streptomyces vinaceus TaxID=1960 RepID=A0A5J6J404_STRVI|nr:MULTISPECIES: MBL fold metallo-hydrolase [Streptomyces]QEV44792.1 MBL fold metallo-hydrolase [Streptomyces vinaceus]ROQ95033.1 L-ascorbate metabolism protein UlaG (beta-lactamase superfamily) [Streptomyces sp. 2132.2]GHE25011.1 MBL fold metallo-hydrolase [Streptomyces vinaceus]